MGTVRVLFFAIAKERAGVDECVITLEQPMTLSMLKTSVFERYPTLKTLSPYVRWAVNQRFVSDVEHTLSDGDEAAIIPPVSGGDRVFLSNEPLDVQRIVAPVSDASNGAVITFIGQVRDHTGDATVTHLEYEAYESMANLAFAEILRDAEIRFSGVSVNLMHRLGRVALAQASVVIAVGSAHRSDAFEACRYIIERLKTDVPIFKREYRDNGSVWVGMGS
jgi:MoaE-MoaD fusion protein